MKEGRIRTRTMGKLSFKKNHWIVEEYRDGDWHTIFLTPYKDMVSNFTTRWACNEMARHLQGTGSAGKGTGKSGKESVTEGAEHEGAA